MSPLYHLITPLRFDKDSAETPSLFNFAFNHVPNAIALLVSEELKNELQTKELKHNRYCYYFKICDSG